MFLLQHKGRRSAATMNAYLLTSVRASFTRHILSRRPADDVRRRWNRCQSVRVWHWSRQCSMGRMQLTGRVKVGVLCPLVLWHPLLICFREWHCPFFPAHSDTTKMLLSRFTRGVEAYALFMPPLLASSKCRSTAIFWLANMSKSPGDFWQLSTLIANISGTHRHVENLNSTWSTTFHPLLGEKIDELWSTNQKVIDAHVDPPNWTFFGRLYFGCWPLKFLHTCDLTTPKMYLKSDVGRLAASYGALSHISSFWQLALCRGGT